MCGLKLRASQRRPTPLPTPNATAKRLVSIALALVLGLAATVGGAWVAIEGDGNVHVLDPGVVVRSAEPSGARLADIQHRYGIRSVINLRGDNTGAAWYDEEIGASKELGLQHFDVALSAERRMTPAQIDDVLAMIERAPKPVLIHCKSGADRTGLISAAWLRAHGATPEVAGRQLALRYGHFPWLGSRTVAMDESLQAFELRGRVQPPAASASGR